MSRQDHRVPSRREFVVAAGLGGAALMAGPAPAVSPSLPALGLLAGAQIADWQARLGDRFVVTGADTRVELVAVEPLAAPGRRPGTLRRPQAFAAMFETSDAGAPEGDDLYDLRSPDRGNLVLHLGRRAEAAGRSRYVAVFN